MQFLNRILLFYPKITNFGPIQLGIIANISWNVENYPCAKFHAFIKKWTMNAIIRWTIDINVYSHLSAYTNVKVVNLQYLLLYGIKISILSIKESKKIF